MVDFNPHSHKGSDRISYNQKTLTFNFNPHSHKGSDQCDSSRLYRQSYFNPHSHKGSDDTEKVERQVEESFQSTLP